MTNEKQKEEPAMPDFNEEELWKEFNQKFWLLVNDAENSKSSKNSSPDFFDGFAEEVIQTVAVKDSRKKECLSFDRCEEAAETPGTLTKSEKVHLLDCQYCERRIAAYSELEIPEPLIISPTENADFGTGDTKNVIFAWFEQLTAAISKSLVITGSFAALLLIGIVGFFILRHSPDSPDLADVLPPVIEPEIIRINDLEDKNSPPDSVNSPPDPNASKNFGANEAPKSKPIVPQTLPKSVGKIKNSDFAVAQKNPNVSDETEGVSLNDLDDVVAALNNKELRDSEILELFQKTPEITRGGTTDAPKMKPISPVNRTVTESNPILIWEGEKDAEYTVTVKSRNGAWELNSETLRRTRWEISKPLSTGVYFWTVTTKKSEKTFKSSRNLFYVISGKEKKELENVRKNVRSRLARAAIYYKYGLLDDAERELETELKKNNSPRAEAFLQQVQEAKQKIKDQEKQP